MRIHWVAAIFVLLSALILDIAGSDLLLLMLAISLVVSAELVNTAMEKAVDLTITQRHPLAKAAKDAAAGAVLILAVLAVLIGIFVFSRPLGEWTAHLRKEIPLSPVSGAVVLILVWMIVLLLENVYLRDYPAWRPSMSSAMAFAVPPVITVAGNASFPVALLGFLVSSIIFVVLGGKRRSKLQSLTVGALVGNVVTLAALILIYFV